MTRKMAQLFSMALICLMVALNAGCGGGVSPVNSSQAGNPISAPTAITLDGRAQRPTSKAVGKLNLSLLASTVNRTAAKTVYGGGGSTNQIDYIAEAKKRITKYRITLGVSDPTYFEVRYSFEVFADANGQLPPLNPIEGIEVGTYSVQVCADAFKQDAGSVTLFCGDRNEAVITTANDCDVVISLRLNSISLPATVVGLPGRYLPYSVNDSRYSTYINMVDITGYHETGSDSGTYLDDENNTHFLFQLSLLPPSVQMRYSVTDENGKDWFQTVTIDPLAAIDEVVNTGSFHINYVAPITGNLNMGLQIGVHVDSARVIQIEDLGDGRVNFTFDRPLSENYSIVEFKYDDGTTTQIAAARVYGGYDNAVVKWVDGLPPNFTDKKNYTITMY